MQSLPLGKGCLGYLLHALPGHGHSSHRTAPPQLGPSSLFSRPLAPPSSPGRGHGLGGAAMAMGVQPPYPGIFLHCLVAPSSPLPPSFLTSPCRPNFQMWGPRLGLPTDHAWGSHSIHLHADGLKFCLQAGTLHCAGTGTSWPLGPCREDLRHTRLTHTEDPHFLTGSDAVTEHPGRAGVTPGRCEARAGTSKAAALGV